MIPANSKTIVPTARYAHLTPIFGFAGFHFALQFFYNTGSSANCPGVLLKLKHYFSCFASGALSAGVTAGTTNKADEHRQNARVDRRCDIPDKHIRNLMPTPVQKLAQTGGFRGALPVQSVKERAEEGPARAPRICHRWR
jgi:hypothetical protein